MDTPDDTTATAPANTPANGIRKGGGEANSIHPEIAALITTLTAETQVDWRPPGDGTAIVYCTRPDGAYLDVWQPNHGPACWRLWWKIATDGAEKHIFTEITGRGTDCLDAARAGLDQDRATRWVEGYEWHPIREWSANTIGWVATIGSRLAKARISQDGYGDLWGWRVEDKDGLFAAVIDRLGIAGFDIPRHHFTGEATSFDAAVTAVIDAPCAFRATLCDIAVGGIADAPGEA